MSKIYNNICDLIGETPLLRLENYCQKENIKGTILAKLEYYNPAGSVKDRVAKNIIEKAEKRGELKSGGMIIEATSGNTGLGLAAIGARLGYSVVIVMPETMSEERKKLTLAYGAELVLTKGSEGMKGAVNKAIEIHKANEGSIIANQFENLDNPDAHYNGTAVEIFEATEGKFQAFISAFGTGGTVSGVGKYLKEQNKEIKIIAVEPENSPLLSKGTAGPHKIQGIGANFVPNTLNTEIIDEIILANQEKALEEIKNLAKYEGIFCGISSGACLSAAKTYLAKEENKGKTVVCILPDTGERYLSVL